MPKFSVFIPEQVIEIECPNEYVAEVEAREILEIRYIDEVDNLDMEY